LKESKISGYLAEEWFRSIHIEKNGSVIFESIINLIKLNSYETILENIHIKKLEFQKYKNEFDLEFKY